MSGTLGCGRTYKIELVFVQMQNASGQALPAPVQWSQGELRGVTRVQWGRVAGGVSEATITVSGATDTSMCCDQISQIQPRMFEIRIWRDNELVWEGPITQDVETSMGGDYVLSAADVLWWGDGESGRPNLYNLAYNDTDPTTIAVDVLTRNLTDTYAAVDDYPIMLDYLYTEPVGELIDWAPGLVVTPLVDLLDELGDYGLSYTVLGRSVYLTPPADTSTAVTAQLTQEDTNSPVNITQDGDGTGNVGIAVRPNADSDLPPTLFITGSANSPYRGAYRIVEVDEAVSNSTATRAARRAISGRAIPPMVVTMEGQAQLYPSAPIQINEIIPGWTRVDFVAAGRGTEGLCKSVQQAMSFAELQVDWVPGQEQVQVSMVPLGSPLELEGI
jgi:hypothetical protein